MEPLNRQEKIYIKEHLHEDAARLMLSLKDESMRRAVLQVECRRKSAGKLAPFLEYEEFIFPDRLASEQSTHHLVARFHAQLLEKGEKVVDLTAGLGIDAMTMAAAGHKVTAIEIVSEKAEALRLNAATMDVDIEVVNDDCRNWLNSTSEKVDTMFIDPARRDGYGGRTYSLKDCTPPIHELIEMIGEKCERMLVKVSPLLDVTALRRELPGITRAWAVAAAGECKELLLEWKKGEEAFRGFTAVDIDRHGEIREFTGEEGEIEYAQPQEIKEEKYLYEPSPAMMKVAAWSAISSRHDEMKKLSAVSHLYISERKIEELAGRWTKIEAVIKGKEEKRLKGISINVVSRGYPLSAPQLEKKLKIKGGSPRDYLYAAKSRGGNLLLLTREE